MVDQPSPAMEEPHHGRGVRPAKVLGRGLGGVAIAAGVLIMFGPFLLAPLTLAVRAWRAAPADNAWLPWVLALVVGLGVIGVQLLFAVQRNPLVRTLTVVLFSAIFSVGAWLFFTRNSSTLPSFAEPPPWWERLGQNGWIAIAIATLIYSAVYLFLLRRLDDRPWTRRLQMFGGGRPQAEPEEEPTRH